MLKRKKPLVLQICYGVNGGVIIPSYTKIRILKNRGKKLFSILMKKNYTFQKLCFQYKNIFKLFIVSIYNQFLCQKNLKHW